MSDQGLEELEQKLTVKYGELVGNLELRLLLGYKSYSSFNRAVRSGKLEVKVFKLESRRGLFALTTDVAIWINSLKISNEEKQEKSM